MTENNISSVPSKLYERLGGIGSEIENQKVVGHFNIAHTWSWRQECELVTLALGR
jgi:hypothetical protein